MATESFFSSASLALLASAGAGKDGTAYSIKPTDGTGDFTFSRGADIVATRVGADGLIEKYRENLLEQSNQFDTTWATSTSASVSSGQTGYDGSSNAWLLSKTAASQYIQQQVSFGGINTFSVYIKAGTSNWVALMRGDGQKAFFDLSGTGALGSVTSGITSKIEIVGNGWFRCSFTFQNSTTNYARIYPADGNNDTTGTSGSIYIQDAQLEIGLAATDYIESGASTGKAGLLEDEPRFDYSGGATCPSLLLEPSRTQIVRQSEYIHGYSSKVGCTTTPNYGTSPEGLTNSTRLEFSANGYIHEGVAQVSGTQYTISLFAKRNDSGTQSFGFFVNGSGAIDSAITLTNEWKRFDYTYTASNSSFFGLAGDSGADVSVYGFQLEAGSYGTSYIPNHSGGSATRTGDDATLSNINTNIVDITGDFTFFVDNTGSLMNGNELYYYFIELYWDAVTSVRYYSTNNGGWYFKPDNSYTGFSNSVGRQIIKYENGVFYHFLNGSKSTDTRTMATTNSLSRIKFLTNTQGKAGYLDVKQALLFDTALSDADCITLTT